jgi:hypothetical protein
MLPTRILLTTLTSALIFSIHASGATITLSEDTVVDASFSTEDNFVVVDGANPLTSVSIVDGAILNGDADSPLFDIYDSSIVKMFGGFLDSFPLPELRAHDSSRIEVYGGDLFQATFELLDNSSLHLSGDTGLFVAGHGNSVLRVNGGESFAARMRDHSRIVQTSGSSDDILLYDNSTFVMHDGFIGFSLQTFGNSRALFNGGMVGGLDLVLLNEQSVVTMRGGLQLGEVHVNDEALLHVYGFGLEFVFEDDEHFVQGTLADGAEANFRYRLADQDQIILHEVPEPATCGILLVGLAGLLAARRYKLCAATR